MNNIPKRRLLKAAQTALAMDQDDYMSMLVRVTGKHSSTLLTESEINAVLTEFKRLGYNPVNKREKYIKKISYLWLQLGEAGKLKNPSKAAMVIYCKRTCKGSIYKATITELNIIIESLKAWCTRENVKL
jgi:phage gp16-like protein